MADPFKQLASLSFSPLVIGAMAATKSRKFIMALLAGAFSPLVIGAMAATSGVAGGVTP